MRLFSSYDGLMVPGVVAAISVAGAVAVNAEQQRPSGPPNALQGFSQNRDKLIRIRATSMEVRDGDKVATFSGDVRLIQGDVTLYSRRLAVFYDGEVPAESQPPATPINGKEPAVAVQITPEQIGRRRVTRIEAKGGVAVQQKDQTAVGDTVIFDMSANTVEIPANFVITRGPNVLKGDKLTVNMDTGDSRMTSRYMQLFIPSQRRSVSPP